MTDTNWYANVLKGWQVKLCGPKPAAELLATVHALGLRPGKQALANAMYLRAEGATSAQVVAACGAPQLNRMRGLITAALAKRVPMPADGVGHTVYRLSLTPKGLAKVAKAGKVAAEAAAAGEAPKAAAVVVAKRTARKAVRKAAKAVGAARKVALTPAATVAAELATALAEAPAKVAAEAAHEAAVWGDGPAPGDAPTGG